VVRTFQQSVAVKSARIPPVVIRKYKVTEKYL
jgi:hypothetical protein